MTQAEIAVGAPRTDLRRPKRERKRWTSWALIAGGALLAAYTAMIAFHWPFTKEAVIKALEERSARTVTISRFYRTYFPPGCTAEDIRFLHRKHKEKQPLITVERLVMTTSYRRILTFQERLSLVRVTNMHVTVPPSEPSVPNPVMPLTSSSSAPAIKIDKIIADEATLDFVLKSGKPPYRVSVHKLRLDGVGNNVPMSYKTEIGTQLPPGTIRSEGTFGTWNPKNPGMTSVLGSYEFRDANLAAFGGVSGTLFSSGSFNGALRQIEVRGHANISNFKVTDTSHERELGVAYEVAVDATSGDVTLHGGKARFDQTTVNFRGSIAKGAKGGGKDASIDLSTKNGRVEDVLRLFISAPQAPMSGAFTFRGHLDIPNGPQDFVRRLKLVGDFGVAGGVFADHSTEEDLTRLSKSSKRAQGNAAEQSSSQVLSNLKGHGSASNGIATLSSISFAMPHAKAWMHGTYGLIDYRVDLHGTLLTSGDPSDATTGFKSLMVKVVTPFLKRKHAAKVIPFKITGSYAKVDMSLDP